MSLKKRKQSDDTQPRRSSLQVNLSFSDSSDTELNTLNINNKQEILDDNVKRLREAILNKTREIFDNHNDFCKKTATILGETESSDQNDQNQLNSQEKKLKLHPVIEESDSNDFSPKPPISRVKNNKEKYEFSPIVSCSNKPANSIIFSPRKTRSSRNKGDISLGDPIKCSTLTDNNSVLLNKPEARRTSHLQCDTPKSSKPVIRNVRSCYIPLDKIDGYERVNKSRNLREVPMELTPAVGNLNLVGQFKEKEIDKPKDKGLMGNNESFGTSMEVRTSVDGVLNDSTMSQFNIPKIDKSGVNERNVNQRRRLSLNRSNRSARFIHPALIESSNNSRRIDDDRASLDVNTSLGSQRRSINASVVEATPYPISRSTLMRTESRFTTVLEKKSLNSNFWNKKTL